MTEVAKRQYEGMFLFDPTFASSFQDCENEIRRLIDRAEGELLFCQLWDERRLAYKVNGRKRGSYVLTYFKAQTDRIRALERDAQLSEPILRALVLRADHVTPDAMQQWVGRRERDESDDRGDRGDRGSEGRRAERRPRDRDRDQTDDRAKGREASKAEPESATADR